MGIFDIFKRKKEEKKEEIKEQEKKEEKKIIGTCVYCNQPIYEDDKYKTVTYQGKSYLIHIRCFRKAKDQAIDFISGKLKI